jgi:nitrous oxidase accessory protein NosD
MTRHIEGIQMDGTRLRHLRTLLVGLALVAGVVRVEAYPDYDDHSGPGGTSGVGCVTCHPRYYDDPSSPTPFGPLHTAHLVKFGISRCGLCHMNPAGGDVPVHTYTSAEGFGCAGCHGQNYGEHVPTGLGLTNEGAPKASAYGLRKALNDLFAAMDPPQPAPCAGCHFAGSPITGDPSPAPALFPETVPPPYYNATYSNLTDPCDSAQESWEGTPPGLDNDGNGFADYAADSACQAFVPTTTTTSTSTTSATSSTTTSTLPGAKRITVFPGQSIQEAIDALAPGGTLYVMPGTYQETHGGTNAVTVSKNGIRMIGRSKPKAGLKVILQSGPGNHNGIVVQPAVANTRIDGFKIKGFTIQGFSNNGILTRYLDNFRIEKNESIDNLENGIWPTLSANGLVKKNVSYGSQDSALWIEASENVRVLKNDLHHSPTGLEITISNNVLAKGNDVHHNTAGVGLYHAYGAGLPPLQPPDRNGDWVFIGNYVHDNNEPNSAPPGSLSASLPSGLGVALIGVDRVTLKNNRIENNKTIGLAISEWCSVAGNCPATPPPDFPDTLPDFNTVVSNVITNNATDPSSGYEGLAADITYVAIGAQGNCLADNTFGTYLNVGGPPNGDKCP